MFEKFFVHKSENILSVNLGIDIFPINWTTSKHLHALPLELLTFLHFLDYLPIIYYKILNLENV